MRNAAYLRGCSRSQNEVVAFSRDLAGMFAEIEERREESIASFDNTLNRVSDDDSGYIDERNFS